MTFSFLFHCVETDTKGREVRHVSGWQSESVSVYLCLCDRRSKTLQFAQWRPLPLCSSWSSIPLFTSLKAKNSLSDTYTRTQTRTHTLTDVCFIFNLCLSTVLWVLWLGNKCWVNMCEQDDIIRRQKTFGIWCCCIHMRSEALEISKSELQTDFQTHVFRASQTEHVFTMNCGIFCQRFSRSASDLNKSN